MIRKPFDNLLDMKKYVKCMVEWFVNIICANPASYILILEKGLINRTKFDQQEIHCAR